MSKRRRRKPLANALGPDLSSAPRASMPEHGKAEAAPLPPPTPTEETRRRLVYSAEKLAARIAHAQGEAEIKQRVYGDTTHEERSAALKAAASALKGTAPPPDIDAILRKIDAMSTKLDALVAQPRASSGISMKSMAFHVALAAEGLIINMVASGLYDLLKEHWSYLMTLTMSEVVHSPSAIAAAKNYARITANMLKDTGAGVLPDLDPIAYRMFLRQLRTDLELDRLFKSMHPIHAKTLRRMLFYDLSVLIASDGRMP